jgi:hypothetical protein
MMAAWAEGTAESAVSARAQDTRDFLSFMMNTVPEEMS